MNTYLLLDAARAMVADDKGLLAMDESHPNCNKRFARFGIEREEMLFASDALVPGGNDYPVKEAGLVSIQVNKCGGIQKRH